MLPLAVILKGMGFTVSGSDRSYDQGRTPEKFAWIEQQGIVLHPQDGSGITDNLHALVISKAVEDTVPDIAAAKKAGLPIVKRAELLVELFNKAKTRIAVSGTSGKTTTTGMIGFILKEGGLDPTINNGGIFRNYAHDNPYSTAFVGEGDIFVTEIDESDGMDIVRQYQSEIAVIHNISLDHQPMEELQAMFSGFLANTRTAVLNADDPDLLKMADGFKGSVVTYSTNGARADLMAGAMTHRANGVDVIVRADEKVIPLTLNVPGAHNVSNALAALCVAQVAGVDLEKAANLLSRFEGIKRRMEIVGVKSGITVMDDFAHNPDKVAATLSTLRQFPGRLHIFFQPHGFGFLKLLGDELAQSFAQGLSSTDRLYMVEPLYLGGTVDRSVGAVNIIESVKKYGGNAVLLEGRDAFKNTLLQDVKPDDRVVIMGARDDTLSLFAREILDSLA
ncbi:MAG: UDP-N-acetylmuramate--alanine ligase [Micavibrio aeruginosavorus]|uniref:UDP-N-acetylmuramate--alanine ligase n=1 Tax=Micavibrio aeruginosavorus TaxID=349221 RepID=A0A2W5N023_9BACT|nr:MAG: UDP-N-acetylmuramate--alanine ligase [Micavibrio aeruginosavorus]